MGDAKSSDSVIIFHHDLLHDGGNGARQDDNQRTALGQVVWLTTFWLPSQQRKHPGCLISTDQTTVSVFKREGQGEDNDMHVPPTTDWSKLLHTALKKIHVEDLGDLAAQELWDNIPEEDSEGRGRKDLEQLEKQLSVKVVFLEKHVLLVGQKTKLEKKCLVMRNVLSHYYWRLKGKQINL